MIPLPKITKKWGFLWEVLDRNEKWALMLQSKDGCPPTYNVVKVIKCPEAKLGKNTIPAKEKIPADSQWGYLAWNFGNNLEAATAKFKELCSI